MTKRESAEGQAAFDKKFGKIGVSYASQCVELYKSLDLAVKALQKIYDPQNFHHWEEDAYTRAGCFQFIAQEALKELDMLKEEK